MEDKELVDGIKESNEIALELLQKKYRRLLYGIAKDIVGVKYTTEDVEDCYSEIVVTIWKNIDSFQEQKGKFINFIAAIAKFKSIDYVRKLGKCKETTIKEEMIEYIQENNLNNNDLDKFKKLINILNEEDRVIFVKRYYFEEEIDKIAMDMNLSKTTIYKRLSRGREKLKNEMEGLLCQ